MNLSNRFAPLKEINFPIMLAPMVGLSHIGLRSLVRRYLPEGAKTLFATEMLSTKRLPAQAVGRTPETLRGPSEDDLLVQILGNEEKYIAPSLKKLEIYGARAIDINMGCPVKQALRHNYGVSLMGDPSYAQDIVAMTVANTHLPVSVKLRAGIQKDPEYLLRFVEGLKKAGASWICLHPRLAEQKRRGNADWEQIKLLRQSLDLTIIGNGDIQIAEDIHAMFDQTDCHGVMIGRALTARPWLLWQMGEDLGLAPPSAFAGKKAPRTPIEEAYAYGDALKFFTKVCQEYFEADQALKRIRFLLHVSHGWLNFGHILKLKIHRAQSSEQVLEILEDFFAKDGLTMTAKTLLRY